MDPNPSPSRLAVVIVNYRTPGLVVDCLASLEPELAELPGSRVVVIEGGSGDDSTQRIGDAIAQRGWGGWVQLMPLDTNGGFAFGNNAAIRPLLESDQPPDYIHLLNPDTYIHPGAVASLASFLDGHPDVGVVGSRLENPDGSVRFSAFRFPGVVNEFDRGLRLHMVSKLLGDYVIAPPPASGAHATDWVSGASMMARREVFEQVGLMDDDYFLYFEETDLMLRARRAGWPTWYLPESRVVHLVGQSTGVTGQKAQARRVPRYWFESRRRYFVKNHGHVYALLAGLAWLTGAALYRLRRIATLKPCEDPPRAMWDFVRFGLSPKGARA